MNCEQSQECMIDVLYGEETPPRLCFNFFQHLAGCSPCHREYLELVETRELLGKWQIEEQAEGLKSPPLPLRTRFFGQVRVWTVLQRIAAAFLIAVGIVSILQYEGLLGGKRLSLSEQQLTQVVHDLIVAQQVEERELMLRALLRVKEDVELQQRENFSQLQRDLISLEQRYVDNLEENNHYLRTLLSR